MPHRNAPLSETGRLRLARCVVDDGWPLRRAADRFQVSPNTAKRWADRYRAEGPAGMVDRSSRPHRSPRRTPAPVERKVLHLRAKRRWGPARIAGRLGLAASTCHAVLRRAKVARLALFHRQVGFDRAVVEDVCLDEDADGEVLVVAARPRKGAMRRCGRCSDEGQQRSVRGRRQRDQSAEGGTRNEAGSTGRLCFGRPATTRRYDSVTSLSTSAGSTSAPARTVIQCFLFMW